MWDLRNISAFAHIPSHELYIFPGGKRQNFFLICISVDHCSVVPPQDDAADVVSPNGVVPNPFTFPLSKVPATQLNGGTVKIVDSRTFNISKTIAAAEVTVEPGAIRSVYFL